MAFRLPIYNFYVMQLRDTLYAGYDEDNMQTIENQLAALLSFGKPGILDGWDVTPFSVPSISIEKWPDGNTILDTTIVTEQIRLLKGFDADPDSLAGQQYQNLGLVSHLDTHTALSGANSNSLYNPASATGYVRVATTGNIALNFNTTIVDGVPLHTNDLVLVWQQADKTQNGVYLVNLSPTINGGNWLRAGNLNSNEKFEGGLVVRTGPEGTVFPYQVFQLAANVDSNDAEIPYVLGTTPMNWVNVWPQCIRVTPGDGIVGIYSATTLCDPNDPYSGTYYFRYTGAGFYYVWAESTLFLVSDQECTISAPLDQDQDYDLTHTAVYLATVEVVHDTSHFNNAKVLSIVYEDRRNQLKNLEGAQQEVIRSAFLHHVHAGGSDHPSKIKLDTQVILTAFGPPGSPIFELLDSNGNPFSGKASDYGPPEVRLNNTVLPSSAYDLTTGNPWFIYLKNSLPAGSILQVIMSMSPQVSLELRTLPTGNIFDPILYLTDGTVTEDQDGNQTQKIYTWDDALWIPALTMTDSNTNVIITPAANTYSIIPSTGQVIFSTFPTGTFDNNSLKVVLTKVGVEITGKLSGKRVSNVDASLFISGLLKRNRLIDLDHVGQVRLNETASLKPYLRLFGLGDRYTFYPELLSTTMQYNTNVNCLLNSLNIHSGKTIFGTKRGLMYSSDNYTASLDTIWQPDYGNIVQIQDAILPNDIKSNKLKTTFMRTEEGKVYRSVDLGSSWHYVPVPSVIEPGLPPTTPVVTAMWSSLNRVDSMSDLGLVSSKYFTDLLVGTERNSVLSTDIIEGGDFFLPSPKTAAQIFYDENGTPVNSRLHPELVGKIHSISQAICINKTFDPDTGNETDTVVRSTFVGADTGFYINGNRLTTDIVKGFLILSNQDVMWFTDHEVFVTHSCGVTVDPDSGNQTWTLPLSMSTTPLATVVAATTLTDVTNPNSGNIVLSGLQNIDGVSVTSNQLVLVKNQTDHTQNGIYKVSSGAWTRQDHATLASSTQGVGQYLPGDWVLVSGGTVNSGSSWHLPAYGNPSYTFGQNINWNIRIFKILSKPSEIIHRIKQRSGFNQYFVCGNNGMQLITDASTDVPYPTYVDLVWYPDQGSANDLVMSGSSAIVATDRGLWKSTNGLYTFDSQSWTRTHNEFTASGPTPVLYNEHDISEVNGWTYNANFQSFTLPTVSNPHIYNNLIYEKDFTHYYVSPWKTPYPISLNPEVDANAEVFVYVNGALSTIAYTLVPEQGLILFTQSLSADDVVRVTIIRKGAYISNTGTIPHLEIPNSYLVATNATTTLTKALAPTDTTITVADTHALPVTTTLVEIHSASNASLREKITIAIDPVTREITIPYTRATQTTYPVGSGLYLVTNGSELGLEDLIIKAEIAQTYNFHSLDVANQIQMDLAARQHFTSPALFDNYGGQFEGNRGPKNAIYFDFSTDTLDPKASSSSIIIGELPSAGDSPVEPLAVYNLSGAVVGGAGTLAGTDQGIWVGHTSYWTRQSSLGGATRTYYMTNSMVGTDKGLYRRSNNDWVADLTFPQTVFDYLPKQQWSVDSSSTPSYFEAYGKDDGLAFIYYNDSANPNSFISDHFDPLDLRHIYGLWTGIYYKISFDSEGNMIQTPVRALYLCTELGLYAVTLGSRGGTFSSLLTGRQMFGDRIPMMAHTLPSGGVEQVPVKFYKIFKFLPTPANTKEPIPIILLSNDGIFKVTNWRWCDPADASTLDFYADNHLLQGVSCYCYAVTTTGDGINTPGVSKAFVGTDRGVYKSFNGGGSWDACERIDGGLTTVFDIKVVSASNSLGYILLAATQYGLFYSDDDGDTWYRPTTSNTAGFDYHISSARHFNDPATLNQGGYLAQTFTITSEAGTPPHTLKISAYLSLTPDDGQIQNYTASLKNTLTASIYAVDINGLPTGSPIAQTNLPDGSFPPDVLTASDVAHPGFYSLFVPINSGLTVGNTYALVLQETVATNGSAIFKWHASSISDPYSSGMALSGGLSGNAWAPISDTDFFFKVYFVPPSTPTITRVDADFTQNLTNGLVLNDANNLTTDFKFAISTCLDDSHSTLWCDPSLNRGARLYNLLTQIFNRSSVDWTVTSNSKLLGSTFMDFWVYGVKTIERTNTGYTSDLSLIQIDSDALYQKGNASELFDAASIALSTLSPQSILDAVLTEDKVQNSYNVTNIVADLQSRSLLRLTDIQNWYALQTDPSGWDGQANTIQNYDDVSSYVVERWANSFSPVGILISDGDATTTTDPAKIGLQATTLWLDQGAKVFTVGLGGSQNEGGLRTVSELTGGRHFFVNQDTDWSDISSSLLHGGDNDIFTGSWGQAYDFDEPTYVQYVYTAYTIPTASGSNANNVAANCVIQYRFTKDRKNWTDWITLSNGIQSTINDLIFGLEYRVVLTDGWDAFAGGQPLRPMVSSLYHMEVIPSVQYLVTYPYDINGMFFEYVLSASVDLPKSARAQWAVGRGLSNDFADFELVLNNRRGCLANRQESVLFTNEVDRKGLKASSTDFITYTVRDADGNLATWSTTDQVTVYVNGRAISSANYSLNGGLAQILFNNAQVPSVTVTVDIITPQMLYLTNGEPTTTKDGRTYYAQNGRWPQDATAIVLVNGKIVRGGYWASPEDGTVTFAKEHERTDLVTIYIQHAGVFRVGLALYNYSSSPITPHNFGLYYSSRSNLDIASQYFNTQPPSIANNQVVLSPNPASVNQRLQITYTFNSIEGSVENNTQTTWWRKIRTGEDTSGFHITSGGYVQLTAANGLPEYNNRTVERSVDVGGSTFQSNDYVYVIVYPSDGINVGTGVASNVVHIGSNQVPYVTDLLAYNPNRVGVWVPPHVSSPNTDPNYQANPDYYEIKAGLSIDAMYGYHGGGTDSSIITWFEKGSLGTPFYIGKTVPEGKTIQGQILYFTVLPYDGTIYGNEMISETVSIN